MRHEVSKKRREREREEKERRKRGQREEKERRKREKRTKREYGPVLDDPVRGAVLAAPTHNHNDVVGKLERVERHLHIDAK